MNAYKTMMAMKMILCFPTFDLQRAVASEALRPILEKNPNT